MVSYFSDDIISTMEPWETILIPVAADYKLVGLAERARYVYPIESALKSYGYGLYPDAFYACGALVFIGRKSADALFETWSLRRAIRKLKFVCEHEQINTIAVQPFGGVQWPTIQEMLINGLGPEFNINIYRRKKNYANSI